MMWLASTHTHTHNINLPSQVLACTCSGSGKACDITFWSECPPELQYRDCGLTIGDKAAV